MKVMKNKEILPNTIFLYKKRNKLFDQRTIIVKIKLEQWKISSKIGMVGNLKERAIDKLHRQFARVTGYRFTHQITSLQ